MGGIMGPFRSIQSNFIFLISSLSISLVISACSNTKQGSLITDPVALSDCPQNSCANGVADASETSVTMQTPLTNIMATGSTFAEVSGDCYASLFPSNYFTVSLMFNGSNVTNFFPSGFVPRCNQGKFYFPISLEGAINGTYNFSASLVVVDSSGVQTAPPFKTITSTIIKR
jgi:hypothetical protein